MGASEKEVASSLDISPQTVHAHVKSLYRGFGVASRAQLLAKFLADAIRALGVLDLGPRACACGR